MMACKRQALVLFLLSLFTFCSSQPHHGGIAVYWGQNNGDGDLITTCNSNHYKIVILAFLIKFGEHRTIDWNFAGHCDHGATKKCYELESEIKHCQEKGIQVFLSIGGDSPDYSLSSAADAKEVANSLYNNFLSGQFGPLGKVFLNGIDLDIERTEDHWDDLTRELDFLRRTKGPHFYLSASPQCPTSPGIYYLGKAIATKLFDYIFVQFYNNPVCDYSHGDAKTVTDSWDKWVSLVAPNNTLFLGLPASPTAAGSGYIDPKSLINDVLPHVKSTTNYGGVVLWDRHHDVDNDYSAQILPYVLKSPFLSVSNAIYECVSKALHRVLPTPRVANY